MLCIKHGYSFINLWRQWICYCYNTAVVQVFFPLLISKGGITIWNSVMTLQVQVHYWVYWGADISLVYTGMKTFKRHSCFGVWGCVITPLKSGLLESCVQSLRLPSFLLFHVLNTKHTTQQGMDDLGLFRSNFDGVMYSDVWGACSEYFSIFQEHAQHCWSYIEESDSIQLNLCCVRSVTEILPDPL